MRYHQDSFVRHQTMQALLDRMLTLRVGKRGSLVQEQYRRILEESSRQSYPLLLSPTEVDALRADDRVQPLWQTTHQI